MNAHFDGSPGGEVVDLAGSPTPARPQGAPPPALCPRCGQRLAPQDAASHALAHELEDQDLAAAAAGGSGNDVNDAQVAAALVAEDRAAAEARDAAAAAQLAAAEWGDGGGGGGWGSGDEGAEDAAHRAQLEDLYFQQL